MMERLYSVELEVADLERSLGFYRDGLRFITDIAAGDRPDCASLRAGEVRLTLRRQRGVGRPRRHRGVSLVIAVQGVDAYYQALVARGLLPAPPRDDDASRWFTILDPDGYRWTFVESTS